MVIQKKNSKLIEKRNLAENYWLFKFEFETDYLFGAGQYVSIKVAESGVRRSYSIASEPGGRVVELLVDTSPMGVGTSFLSKLNVGDEIEQLGPLGQFTLEKSKPHKKLLFVATGSGIAPLRSMIRDLLINKKDEREIFLEWGMRHENDLFWVSEFEELARTYSNFKFDLVLSKPESYWQKCQGHVNDCIEKHLPELHDWEAYLCGSKPMVEGVRETLRTRKMEEENIHFEKFY